MVHRGWYFSVSGIRLDLLPVQRPHPPLWGSSYSHRAAARAGRLLDGIVVGPQVIHEDVGRLVETFRGEWQGSHSEEPTLLGAWRTFIAGRDPRDALDRAIAGKQLNFGRFREGMQEKTSVQIAFELRREDAADWAILGNYEDCLEGLRRCRGELNLTHVTCQFYNLPDDLTARLDWLEGFGEKVAQKL